MRKCLSILIAFAMLLSLTPAAFALENDPYLCISNQMLAVGENTVNLLPNTAMTIYQFTPNDTGTFTVTAPAGVELGYWGAGTFFLYDGTANKTNTLTVELTSPGQGAMIGVTAPGSTVSLTIEKTEEYVEVVIPLEKYVNKHTPAPYTLPEDAVLGSYVNVCETTTHTAVLGRDGYYHLDSADGPELLIDLDYLYPLDSFRSEPMARQQMHATVMEDGKVVAQYDLLESYDAYKAAATENGYYPLTEDLIFFYQEYAINTQALQYWIFEDQPFNPDCVWMFACRAVELPDTGESIFLDGNNYMEIPAGSTEATYTYTATYTGTLYIAATAFGWDSDGSGEYQPNSLDEWNMYTSLTVNGEVLSGGYYGAVQVEKGQTYEFKWEFVNNFFPWGWNATLNLSSTDELLPVPGSEELPVELYIEDVPTNTIEIGAGQSAYYMLYGFDGAVFTVTGENACVTFSRMDAESGTVKDYRYEAVDGVVSVDSPYGLIQIWNDGDSAATFALDAYYPEGSRNNPEKLEEGKNSVSLEANDVEGYYFAWTAPCDGKVTLTISGTSWVYRADYSDGEQYVYGELQSASSGKNTITIDVVKGGVVKLLVMAEGSYDAGDNFTAPATTITVDVSAAYEHQGGAGVRHEATCTQDACTEYTCELCGQQYQEVEEGSMLEHSFVGGACEHCGMLGYILGDVNGDGDINISDAILTAAYFNERIDFTEAQLLAGDVNGDGDVNISDAILIAAYFNERIDQFPAQN